MILGNNYYNLASDSVRPLDIGSMSKGNQAKYYDMQTHKYIKLAFDYQGRTWRDYLVEHLAWRLSTMTDTLGIQIIKQDIVNTNMGYACISDDFCLDGSSWVPMYDLMNGSIPANDYGQVDKLFNKLVRYIKKHCDIDTTDYFIVMIIFDCLLANEDRHYNNFGVLYKNYKFKVAPLFDFGLGLFEHDTMYKGKTLDEAIDLMHSKPFCRIPIKAVEALIRLGYTDKVKRVVQGIRVPMRQLFPNNIGYEYFCTTLDNIRRLLCLT